MRPIGGTVVQIQLRHTQAPGMATPTLGGRRQQRSHPLPQVIWNKISAHSDTLPTKIPKLNSF